MLVRDVVLYCDGGVLLFCLMCGVCCVCCLNNSCWLILLCLMFVCIAYVWWSGCCGVRVAGDFVLVSLLFVLIVHCLHFDLAGFL